jgi:choline dehydrogenase-like flavoprotein
VILPAGAFQSSQILELSAVGDSAILRNSGVETEIENLHVGENLQMREARLHGLVASIANMKLILQSHPLACLAFEANKDITTGEALRNSEVLAYSIAEFQAGRGGPLATSSTGQHSSLGILRQSGNNGPLGTSSISNRYFKAYLAVCYRSGHSN